LRVLFVSTGGTYPFRIGGPSVIAYHLAKELGKKGVTVDFIFGISREHYEKRTRFPHFEFPDSVNLIPVIRNHRIADSYRTALDFELLRDVSRLAKRIDGADVVQFCHLPTNRDVFLAPLASIRGIPCVLRIPAWIRHYLALYPGLLTIDDFLCYRFAREFATKIVCNSRWTMEKTMLDGVNANRIEIIRNGVDYLKFSSAEGIGLTGEPALLYVGRLDSEKGIWLLLEGMKDLEKTLPSAVLHVVGDGSVSDRLKHFVRSGGLDDKVIFHGKIIDTASFYASADICVFPDLIMPAFGVTSLEAMAAGKPIVTTDIGGLTENIEHLENGILVEPKKQALTEGIVRLWKDKDLMGRMSSNNLEKAKEFDWPLVAERWVQLYERLT
jgi:glycosyltransferase involved in cell wall biosynthesis